MISVKAKNPAEPEFHQAVREVFDSLRLVLAKHPEYQSNRILDRIVEPERVSSCSACPGLTIRQYAGQPRFPHRDEQRHRPLQGRAALPSLGESGHSEVPGVRAGVQELADHAAHGRRQGRIGFRSQGQERQRSDALLPELHDRTAAPHRTDTDVPAGDIGVGGREIGYLFGQYKRLRNEFTGVLTGKGLNWGGSLIRPEATGYGCVYFAEEMLKSRKDSLEGKLCLVSGSGNVSQYTIEKLLDLGAKPVTVSDSNGVIYDPDGIDREKLAWVIELKNVKRGRIREYADHFKKAIFMPTDVKLEHNPLWNIKADCAFPSATQNEITAKDAANLIKNGIKLVAEGANMPSTLEATKMFLDAKILYGPAKAANAGGVATSGLEMAQNSARLSWTREEVDDRLHKIMIAIHKNCYETAEKYGTPGNLVNGANIAGS